MSSLSLLTVNIAVVVVALPTVVVVNVVVAPPTIVVVVVLPTVVSPWPAMSFINIKYLN